MVRVKQIDPSASNFRFQLSDGSVDLMKVFSLGGSDGIGAGWKMPSTDRPAPCPVSWLHSCGNRSTRRSRSDDVQHPRILADRDRCMCDLPFFTGKEILGEPYRAGKCAIPTLKNNITKFHGIDALANAEEPPRSN
jgi:hypothetical protein